MDATTLRVKDRRIDYLADHQRFTSEIPYSCGRSDSDGVVSIKSYELWRLAASSDADSVTDRWRHQNTEASHDSQRQARETTQQLSGQGPAAHRRAAYAESIGVALAR